MDPPPSTQAPPSADGTSNELPQAPMKTFRPNAYIGRKDGYMYSLEMDSDLGREYKSLESKQEQLTFLMKHGKKAKQDFGLVRNETRE